MRSIFDEDLLPDPSQPAVRTERERVAVITSELDERRWAVVSFDRIEAGPLTYAEAAAKLAELAELGIAGLCLVAEEAAARMD